MPDDARYEMALAVAIRLLHALDARPLMLRHERLATAVYSVLDTLGGLEIGGSGDSCHCPRCRCEFSPDLPGRAGQHHAALGSETLARS